MDVEDELDDIDDILHYDITRRRFNVEMRCICPTEHFPLMYRLNRSGVSLVV